jgi:quercetin dioxygenase-like cupin family protein
VSNLVDLETMPLLEVWGETVRARRVRGENLTLAIVELAPGAIVPVHHHVAEQVGMVIRGAMRFTVDGETRDLGPGGTWRVPSDRSHNAQAGPDGAIVIDVFAPARADWDDLPESPAAPPAWPSGDAP